MKRVLNTAMGTPGHIDYRALKCADSDDLQTCRQAVLTALDEALSDLGGLSNQANWDGTVLTNAKGDANAKIEDYDAVEHTQFRLIPVPPHLRYHVPQFQPTVEIQAPL